MSHLDARTLPRSPIRPLARLGLLASGILLAAAGARAQDRPAVPGGIYDKPYIKGTTGGTAVGGYMDQELFWNDRAKTFDQHRFIPFLFSQVTDRIHVSTEIEFEHGGNVGEGGEISLEYATLDITLHEALTYRAGIILSPLGRFNLIHDSPLNDFTNRPLMAREIVPTTLSESGMGLLGTFYPSESSLVGYEIYVVNGFNAATADRIRAGRGSQGADNNEAKSVVGRVNYSPLLGLDLGGSFHVGAYDDAGDRTLSILAADATWTTGPWDLRGEVATAGVEGAAQDRRWGYYGQAGYHFLPGVLPRFPYSILTASARLGHIDLGDSDETRFTVGLNVRPVEETVLKLDYEVWDREDDLNGLVFSVTTYF